MFEILIQQLIPLNLTILSALAGDLAVYSFADHVDFGME